MASDYETGDAVWPDNAAVWRLWEAMETQWQVDTVVGLSVVRKVWKRLIYEALPVVEQRLGIKKRERARLFEELREMEKEALAVFGAAG